MKSIVETYDFPCGLNMDFIKYVFFSEGQSRDTQMRYCRNLTGDLLRETWETNPQEQDLQLKHGSLTMECVLDMVLDMV